MLTSNQPSQPRLPTRRTGDVTKRIHILAADLVDLNAEGDARRQRLLELGWPAAFLDTYEAEARQAANLLFVRDVNDDRSLSPRQAEDRMVEIIGQMFPSTQYLVAELQARGVSVSAINLHLRKAKARAALSFIHQGVH
jgi:hypothetical protein